MNSQDAPVLLSGGNPQIAKGDGDGPVQAYIAAMPGWKADVGRQLDAIITDAVPGVAKMVRWNTPFYGAGDGGWFLGFHCLTHHVKLAFLRGAELQPVPPEPSKVAGTRYLHIGPKSPLDETQFRDWLAQAAALPGVGL